MARLRPRLSFANVTSLLALVIAMSGGAYAVTQIPANSVGTKQLKKDAVVSAKVKNAAITGADVNETTLGRVPSAQNAVHADTAGDAATLGGKAPGAFIGVDQQFGGALTGTFPDVHVKPNGIGGTQIFDGSLTHIDIAGMRSTRINVSDAQDVPGPGETVLSAAAAFAPFTVTGRCLHSGANTTASVVIESASAGWSVDSDAPNGATDDVGLGSGEADERTLIQVGPSATGHYDMGSFGAVASNGIDDLIGHVGARIATSGLCTFQFTAFSSTG